jgi:hypothetical protein
LLRYSACGQHGPDAFKSRRIVWRGVPEQRRECIGNICRIIDYKHTYVIKLVEHWEVRF